MNEYALRLERELRTMRDYLEHHVGRERRDQCMGVYVLDVALDAVESANSANSAFELQLPASLPDRDWCRDCEQPCRRR